MAKSRSRQLAIVRRLKGRRKIRTRIGLRAPLLFLAIITIAMAMDMCSFPPSRRNVVLAQSCAQPNGIEGAATGTNLSAPVEKKVPCQ